MTVTNYLDVKDMHSSNCATKIEKALSGMEGLSNISVNYESEKASVAFNENVLDISRIIQKINHVGFQANVSQKITK